MGQIRYHDYLSEIRSKKASEAVAIPIGIGAIFGYNVVFYDGNNLIISADAEKNFRHNLTNERNVLVNPKHGCITPDGILTLETSEVEVPLVLGKFSGTKEVALIASHTFSKVEGGTILSYRVYVNPDQQNAWTPKLKQASATMENWLNFLSGTLRRNQEVVLAIFSVEVVGNDYLIKDIMNPYNYTWGETDYVPLDRYEADMANLKLIIPVYDSRVISLSNLTEKVSSRQFTNGVLTTIDKSNIVSFDPQLTFSTLGDAIHILAGLGFDFSGQKMNLEHQIIVELQGTMDYIMPTPIEARFQTPIAFNYLRTNAQDPVSGEKYQQTTHSVYGLLNMYESNFSLVLQMFPVGDIDTNSNNIAADLSCKADFTMSLSLMASLLDMYTVEIEPVSADGTTGTGDTAGAGRYKKGSLVTLVASPASGSGFVGWYDGNTLLSEDQVYRLEVTKDIKLKAMFNGSSTKVRVSVTVDPQGKATVTGEGLYAINTQATIQCVPSTGYGFDYWEIDGVRYTINPLTFGVSKTTNVKCKLVPPKREVRLFSSPSGIMSLQGAGTYSVNQSVTVTANMLTQDYVFAGWYKDSVSPANLVSTNPQYSFNMPDQDMILYASATEKVVENFFDLRVESSGGGTTSPSGISSYKQGTVVTVSAIPANGYYFLEWRAGGPSGIKLTNDATFQHTVNTDYYYYAVFEAEGPAPTDQVLIRTNSWRGGLTTPVSQYYDKGSRVTINATPSAGYKFKEWRLNSETGTLVSSNASYTFTANESATYWAIFEETGSGGDTHSVNLQASSDGSVLYMVSHSVAPSTEQSVDQTLTTSSFSKNYSLPAGSVIQLIAQTGSKEFDHWEYTINGTAYTSTEAAIQFTISGNLTLVVKAIGKTPPAQEVTIKWSITKNNTPSVGTLNMYRNGVLVGDYTMNQLPANFTQTATVGDTFYVALPGVVVSRIRTAHMVNGEYIDTVDPGNTSTPITIEAGSSIVTWAVEGGG